MHGEYKPPGGKLVAADVEVAGGASGWHDHDWRFVREEPQDPALHMALDEVLAREVAARRRPPTLRIWEWSAPAVVIGSFQSLRNEVDMAEAGRLGIMVVRRVSGGGAMFVEPASTITYSLYAPESLVAGMSYAYLDDWVIGALRRGPGHLRLVPAAQRHRLRTGQDRRRGADAAGGRCRAPPRDDGIRHRREHDDAGAADQP
jgi:hypothetical protein